MNPHLIAILATSLLFVPQFAAAPLTHSASSAARAVPQDFTLQGKISKLEGNKITVSTEENIIFHVVYDDKTIFRKKDGSPGAASDLKVNLMIAVAGDLAESGEITAKKISIQ